ncbi:MAG: phosphatidate cytidylyltransferase [Phycisphaera sp.]|nr:phosphatidate cytidylyltransferase [Phycisphaera sp.]
MERFIDKLWSPDGAFDHPVTLWVTIGLAAVLLVAPLVIRVIGRVRHLDATAMRELNARHVTWLILVPIMMAPVLIGPGATILFVAALSLCCYAEFARATGMFRWRAVSLIVVLGIVLTTFAVYDHWYGLFVALPSLLMIALAIAAMRGGEPSGYLQRLALAVLAYLLFGVCLGHLGYMANDANYRPLIISVMLCVELNDIFAFCSGKLFGKRRIAPRISPNKTVAGSVGALLLTTATFTLVGHFTFAGQSVGTLPRLVVMGAIISIAGQLGDLVVSAVKRDLNLKDMGTLLPGHGGLLDRFDSTLLVAPAIFHYIGFFQGVGLDQPARILSGS